MATTPEKTIKRLCSFGWATCPSSQYGAPPNANSHVCGEIVDVPAADAENYAKRTSKCKKHKCSWCKQKH